jgi:hypothetical protein
MRAKLDLGTTQSDTQYAGTRSELGSMENTIYVAVGRQRSLGEVSLATDWRADAKDVSTVLVPGTPGTTATGVEVDLIDGFRKTPDRLTRLTGERLSDWEMDDVRRERTADHVGQSTQIRDASWRPALANEECDRYFVVVAEVVFAIVDAGDAQQSPPRQDLCDFEIAGREQSLGSAGRNQPSGGRRGRVAYDAGHGDGSAMDPVAVPLIPLVERPFRVLQNPFLP